MVDAVLACRAPVVEMAQLDESQSRAMKVPVVVTLITTAIEAPPWTRIVPVDPLSVVAALTVATAATYGPTNGPPSPVGAAPTGFTAAFP